MSAGRKWSRTTAHPRVSGENVERNGAMIHADGSSPRERGKLTVRIVFQRRYRLIPA